MVQVSAEEARDRFAALLNQVREGAVVEITSNGDAVAHLVPVTNGSPRPVFGCLRGVFVVPDDFDEPLEDFQDYS